MIHKSAFHKEVADKRFPCQFHVAASRATMQQIGMPDQHIAFAGMKVFGFQFVPLY